MTVARSTQPGVRHRVGLPFPLNPVAVTGWVALGCGFRVAGLGLELMVAAGLATMGCTMHQFGWPPYVGVPHPCWVQWHPTRMSMAPPGAFVLWPFPHLSHYGLAPSQGDHHPITQRSSQVPCVVGSCEGLFHTEP